MNSVSRASTITSCESMGHELNLGLDQIEERVSLALVYLKGLIGLHQQLRESITNTGDLKLYMPVILGKGKEAKGLIEELIALLKGEEKILLQSDCGDLFQPMAVRAQQMWFTAFIAQEAFEKSHKELAKLAI